MSAKAQALPEVLHGFIEQASQHLAAYQNKAWAQRYTRLMRDVQQATQAAGLSDDTLSMTVARSLHKLMSYKDEYEVARLFSDKAFQAQLDAQFEGDYRLAFHMSPPALFKESNGKTPRKVTLGAWMRPVLGLLAKAKVLRGTIWDPFGYPHERRMERHLIDAHITLVQEVLPLVNTKNKDLMRDIMALPLSMRGFGHVKARNVRAAQSRQAWLFHRIDPTRYPRPPQDTGLQQFRGVAIRSV